MSGSSKKFVILSAAKDHTLYTEKILRCAQDDRLFFGHFCSS